MKSIDRYILYIFILFLKLPKVLYKVHHPCRETFWIISMLKVKCGQTAFCQLVMKIARYVWPACVAAIAMISCSRERDEDCVSFGHFLCFCLQFTFNAASNLPCCCCCCYCCRCCIFFCGCGTCCCCGFCCCCCQRLVNSWAVLPMCLVCCMLACSRSSSSNNSSSNWAAWYAICNSCACAIQMQTHTHTHTCGKQDRVIT